MTLNEMRCIYPAYKKKERILKEKTIDNEQCHEKIKNEPAADHHSEPVLTPDARKER